MFCLCVLFVYLALAAQFESLILPLAIILIVPLSLLAALAGVWLRGLDNNILTQIGLVVLVGLACKNAILIVEFAAQLEAQGKGRVEAAIEACRLRFRAILMTAFSFILGVIPLVIATGAGAEMRVALGTAVFAGMLGVTLFGCSSRRCSTRSCAGSRGNPGGDVTQSPGIAIPGLWVRVKFTPPRR